MVKSVYLNLIDLIVLYLLELRNLLYHYINLLRNFFDKIGSSYIYFNYKKPKYQSNIIIIIFYHKIVKTRLCANNKLYNNKKRAV